MDPLSVTASVVAVLQAANCVVSICYDFRAAIKDHPWALTRITNSINELRLILSRLEQVANESELEFDEISTRRASTLKSLCQDGGAIMTCFEELTVLEKKLAPVSWAGKDGSKRRALIQSIGWQFKSKDAEEVLKRLDGYKATLNLALTMDQAALIKTMSKTMKDVDENTRTLFKQFQDVSLDDRKRSILQWLSAVDPSINHEAALKIRQAGTNDWFLSCKEYNRWQEAKKSSLWLSGFPGSGKTILMSTVIEYLQQRSGHQEPPLVAYFYCDFRNPETRDPLNLAGSLLAQLCFKIGSFPVALDEAFERSKISASTYGKRINLGTIIEILIELTSQHRVTIIVDALDECERRQDILELFQILGRKGRRLNIIVSSRDETDIREALVNYPRMRLEAASASIDRDIEYYINSRLGHDADFKWLKQSFKRTIRERLSAQANGMFRWVQCQIDHIAKLKTMKDIRKALDNLPEGLQETYENILEKVATQCVVIVRQILQWLVCDVSTLTLAELHECLAIELGMDNIDEEAQLSSPMDIYDLCRTLIAVTAEGEVILAHLSVKDYLLSDAIRKGKASAFALSEPEANAENALKCLTYLSFAEFRSGPARRANEFEARLLNYPFFDHASKWWASYFHNAGSSSEELKNRVLEFFAPQCHPQFMSWLQVMCSEVAFSRGDGERTIARRKNGYNYYPKHATPLYYAASFGIEHVVRALLAQGADVDATGGRLGATAFHAAALRGHLQVMDILYKKGADPNKKDFIGISPLHSAILTGNTEALKYLLEHGAEPEAKDDRGRTAHHWAYQVGNMKALKVLDEMTAVKKK